MAKTKILQQILTRSEQARLLNLTEQLIFYTQELVILPCKRRCLSVHFVRNSLIFHLDNS
jgi:hypothetical protein